MKTHRPRTPLEMMIDKAMGFDSCVSVPIMVPLVCVGPCGNRTDIKAAAFMPEGTVRITVTCEKCGGNGDDVTFYTAQGVVL